MAQENKKAYYSLIRYEQNMCEIFKDNSSPFE